MIWTTAKSTDVNRRSTVRPMRSKTSGFGGRAVSAHVVTGLAIASSFERSDGCRLEPGRIRRIRRRGGDGRGSAGLDRRTERAGEVGDEIVEVLEPHGAAQEARRDPGGVERGVVELTMGRRRWVGHDREDAPER